MDQINLQLTSIIHNYLINDMLNDSIFRKYLSTKLISAEFIEAI